MRTLLDAIKKGLTWLAPAPAPTTLPEPPTQVPTAVTESDWKPLAPGVKWTTPLLLAPPFPPLVSNTARERVFGSFDYIRAPTRANPERIIISGGWQKANIVWVPIPQLVRIPGAEQRDGTWGMDFHRLGAAQLKALWEEWQQAGLLHCVLSFEGSFAPRFVRGSTKTLSNHAFGNAFDINYQWNKLGDNPAPAGAKGSVRELVGIAAAHGFFWGGFYRGRADGMHFELAKLLPTP